MKTRKIVSWNVNGIRAVMKKDFISSMNHLKADIVSIQETKISQNQLTDEITQINGYASYFSHATTKKGYSGVALYTMQNPVSVGYGMGISKYDDEGRIIEADYGEFVLFCVYFPNGQMSDERLQYKLDFYAEFFSYLENYKKNNRYIIICGDFNTAHNEIDLKNPKSNEKRSGFLRIERDVLDKIVSEGYVDTFRHFYPETEKYSWWSYRFNAREKNVGWRIDYVFVSENMIQDKVVADAFIENNIYGSDHCPVGITLNV